MREDNPDSGDRNLSWNLAVKNGFKLNTNITNNNN